MNRPIVSLIVPVYNCERYLPQCLDSICNQTLREIEIILVDDGSNDLSPEICRQYAGRDERIVYVRQENRGVSAARNVALDKARGTYIAFLDADDWMDADHLETLVAVMQEKQADCAVCGYQIEFAQRTETRVVPAMDNMDGQRAIAAMLVPELFQGFLWNKLFRLDLIRRERLYLDEDLSHYEDMLFCAKYFDCCQKVSVQETATYHYRQRTDSAVRYHVYDLKWLAGRKSVLAALERVLGLCRRKENCRLCRARIQMEKAETLRRVLTAKAEEAFCKELICEVRAGLAEMLLAPLGGKHKIKYLSTAIFPVKSAKFWTKRDAGHEKKVGMYNAEGE